MARNRGSRSRAGRPRLARLPERLGRPPAGRRGRRGRRPRRTRRTRPRPVAARGPAGDDAHPAAPVERDVPLEDDAGGDPLADQLQQPAAAPRSTRSCSTRGSPHEPTSLTRSVEVSRSQSAASTCSQGTRRPVADVERVAGAATTAPSAARSRPAPSPPRATSTGGLRTPPHAAPTVRSRSLRRCCSRAASSPNIRLYSAGVLDRVGALQPRLQVGDPAQAVSSQQPVDVQRDVGRRPAPSRSAAARRRAR